MSDPRLDRIRVLLALGWTCAEVGADPGVNLSLSGVWRRAKAAGIPRLSFREGAARSNKLREAGSKREAIRRRAIVMPRWVPPDLAPDFRDFARLFGEEEAASRVRRLKREAMEHA
jgi:hypothetical protein